MIAVNREARASALQSCAALPSITVENRDTGGASFSLRFQRAA
jgi:hypothetical protein